MKNRGLSPVFTWEFRVMIMNKKITIEQALEIATSAVSKELAELKIIAPDKLLEDEYLEAEHCWIFLRNKNIVIPPKDWFLNPGIDHDFQSSQTATPDSGSARFRENCGLPPDFLVFSLRGICCADNY
jgi:hypothetical protein